MDMFCFNYTDSTGRNISMTRFLFYKPIRVVGSLLVFAFWLLSAAAWNTYSGEVRAWEEKVTIPTYQVGPSETNPIFYTHESYQGAQKRIYPYALIDRLTQNRFDQEYTLAYLENEYVQIAIMPELGGRLFSAIDKTNGYDFFYHQHVIKPALIGMLGAWISGGIEWCVFHHHRNTTFMPVEHLLTENPDGSKTIWFGETEQRHRMKWTIGLTLYPDQSYLEATVKLFNRTSMPNSILYWANVAVHVNDDYQVIFPPSVQVATYHSKIDFTTWPISQGRYRGSDYTNVDVSWWKNSENSNSFFAWNLQENFMGGYDHGKDAGVVHVANHHIVCGAKLWEWGVGSNGKMWDNILTDADGPYAELMVGAFSDNQPDYSWIKPREVKTFKQYWYPVRNIGGFKNANLSGAVNMTVSTDGKTNLGFHSTSNQPNIKVLLTNKGQPIFERTIDIDPAHPFVAAIDLPAGAQETDLRASILSSDGQELIAYQPIKLSPVERLPETVKAPLKPEEIKTNDELYFTGLRIEQIHNPTVDPTYYYQEALRRDPGDARCHTMMGIHYNRKGMYDEARQHLVQAIVRVAADYTRPINTEAYYQLGLAWRGLGDDTKAYDAFYRATWDSAFHSAAYAQLAELSCKKSDYSSALEQINYALNTNALDTKALTLKAVILRHSGQREKSMAIIDQVLAIDPLDFFARFEGCLSLTNQGIDSLAQSHLNELDEIMRLTHGDVQIYLEMACDYLHAGFYDEAIAVLQIALQHTNEMAGRVPLVHYYLGYLNQLKGNSKQATTYFEQGRQSSSKYCFPFRQETAVVLNAALEANPNDARATFYLGNLMYENQPDKAIAYWEKSRLLDATFSPVHRNLGWASYRTKNDIPQAIDCYEKAVQCDPDDSRLYYELDTLYEHGNASPERRLAVLENHHLAVDQYKESAIREILVLILNGRYDDAIHYLENLYFHAREGSDDIHDAYVDAHLLQGIRLMEEKQYAEALQHFQKATEYPENLSVGRSRFDHRGSQINYFTGLAYDALGDPANAEKSFTSASSGSGRGFRTSDARYYQAASAQKLDQDDVANRVFDEMIRDGQNRLKQDAGTDFFAKFGEQESARMRNASAHFILGLAYLGKGDKGQAKQELQQAVELNQGHVWARYYLSLCE